MNLALTQRQLALAGVALLAAVFALAFKPGHRSQHLPKSIPANQEGGWFKSVAASHGDSFKGDRTNCGYAIDEHSLGLASSTLPCNTKIYIVYKKKRALTQVIATGAAPGAQFELTPELAQKMALKGTESILWRYAAGGRQ